MTETFGQCLRRLRGEAGLSQAQLARMVPIHQSNLSRWEGDRQAVEDRALVERLETVLGAPGALTRAQAPSLLHGDGIDSQRIDHAVRRPRTVDDRTLDALAELLASTRHLEDCVGAAAVLLPERGHVNLLTELANEARGPIRPRVIDLAGQWAQHHGWLYTALERYDEADQWFSRSLEWALEAGDDDLAATVWSFKGHVAWLKGQVGPTIGLTHTARRYTGIHAGQTAYDALQEARGHALLGDVSEVERLVDEAHALSELATQQMADGSAPPWHYYRGDGFWNLEGGRAIAPVRPRQAVELLEAGLAELPPDQLHADWADAYRRDLEAAQRASA